MINKKIILRVLFIALFMPCFMGAAFSQQNWNPGHSVGTANGIYNYPAGGISTQLVEINPAAIPNTGLTYQWYSSTLPTTGFNPISGATSSTYTVPAPFTVTTYYYRVTYAPVIGSLQSNTIKLSLASVNWEDINYVREHDVLITNQTIWNVIDQLPIGSKLQTTTYMDGLGRPLEKVSKQTATPPLGGSTWGDLVQFSQYDVLGRELKKYLPYTTTNQSGVYKTSAVTDQAAYYSNASTYNETSAYSIITYDNSPLNRVNNVKEPGTNWGASAGNTVSYDMNTGSTGDNVQIWDVDYVQGDAPVHKGVYAANTLHKVTYTDVNNNMVVEFTNMAGQLILKKVQAVSSAVDAYTGWLCTYSVYDDFGLLRYEIQPEGVKWLYANSWNFAATNGSTVLAEQVFQYNYDDKGRTIWKKTPGVAPLNMVYDSRDRIVFMQDGNQAGLATPQWTANLYDVLDRHVATLLLNTTEPLYALQTDVANAAATSSISVTGSSNTGGTTIPLNLSLCPGSINSSILSYGPTTVLNYMFYDNYSFANAQAFSTTYTNLNAYSTSDPNVTPIAASNRTLSMPTGRMERVLGSSSSFLSSTNYYDEKGEPIQTLKSNIKSGTDITTLQYRFDGRMLSSCNSHTNSSAGYTGFITLNKYIFDYIGRVTSIQKTIGSNAAVTLANYSYDDMGRVNSKILAPGYSNPTTGLSQLETLNYTFNIHNQITGINRDYALKTAGLYSKWTHYFGMDLGYDKTDNTFSATQLNGQVAGIAWNTMGDDAQRKYDYTYDNAGRLIKANFNQQHPGDGWSNTSMDFSVSGTSGYITYDNNGNLLTMLQKGVMPGQSAPLVVDDLRYTYKPNSNKLDYVTDQMTLTSLNGNFGDFKDGTNAANTSDYVYDNDGNVVVDLNKNSQSLNNGAAGTPGIHYNYLDKPDQIRIVGKGTILIAYSAGGEKLQRAFIPDAGGSSTITTYIGAYTYQETSASLTTSSLPPFIGTAPHLAYMNFEEGRVRAMTTTSTTNGYDGVNENGNIVLPAAPSGGYSSGAWDYFIMDYQQNVRMILTEETHSASNQCTMELTSNRPAAEDPVFGQTGESNEVEATRIVKPTAWSGNTSSSVCHLGVLSGHTLGPNSLQKVMAGDLITASVNYYYPATSSSSNPNIITNLLTSLSSLITNGGASVGTLTHGAATNISSNLNATSAFVNTIEPDNYTSGTPQAYITILFFDERFNFISAADGGVYQAQVRGTDAGNTNAAPIGFNSEKAPKNGYVYIYISNRSDQDVFFDNLSVNITTGNIIEENHYYPYGLKIAAISSKKFGDIPEGSLQNNYQYQGSFSEMDADIGWNDFELRNYDPQIGRFVQQDPFGQFASGYLGMGNDPSNLVDPSGGIGIPCPGTSQLGIFFMKAGETLGNIASAANGLSSLISIGISFARVGTEVFNSNVQSKIINSQLAGNMTLSVGNDDNPNYWILYNGTQVNIYQGEFGNTHNLVKSFKGSSGIVLYSDPEAKKVSDDFRNAKYQFTQQSGVNEDGEIKTIYVGPVPHGSYTINLSLNPDRQAKVGSNGETIPGEGIERITIVRNGIEQARYPAWGSIRAKLDADPGTNLGGRDGNFYFHNSDKGYTHGCVETESEFFSYLLYIRKIQPTLIRVKIEYPSKNASTNGHTNR